MAEDGWSALAEAIVLQAAEDYSAALRILRRRPGLGQVRRQLCEVERFFRSPWFGALSGLDPEALIQKLKEEAA